MAGRFPPRIFRRVSFEAEIRIRFEEAGPDGGRLEGDVLEVGGEEIVARTANISLGGMFVISPEPRPVGTAFELEFKLPEQPAPVRGRGRVVWNREEGSEDAPPGMGVRFLELTPGSRELIFQVVERRVRDGGSPYDEGSQESGSIADRLAVEPESGAPGTWMPEEVATPDPPSLSAADEPSAEDRAPVGDDPFPPEASPAVDDPSPEGTEPAPPSPVRLVEMPVPEPQFPLEPAPEPAVDSQPVASGARVATGGAGYARSQRGRSWLWVAVAAILLVGAGTWYWIGRSSDAAGAAVSDAQAARLADEPAPSAAEVPGEEASEEADEEADEEVMAAEAIADLDSSGAASAAGRENAAEVALQDPPAAPEPPVALAERIAVAEPVVPAAEARRISRITWEESDGGTELVIWGDGAFGSDSYRSYRLEGASPREVVRLLGIGEPFEPGVIEVGTQAVRRVRTGLHLETDPDELHVVIDLAGPGVGPVGIRPDGSRLRLRLEGR